MIISESISFNQTKICSIIWQIIFVALFTLIVVVGIYAQQNTNSQTNENVITFEEVKDAEIFAFGKTVIIKKSAKGVLVFGGDVIIEGNVEGDAAVIGGSIFQKNDAFIGGDVIIFGGKYQHERQEPLRSVGKETIMYAGYEEELKEITQNPSQIFSPQLSWSYFAQRVLSVLFWFLVTLGITTIAPGAVSRAVTRFQLSNLKVVGLGLLTFIVVTIFVILSFSYLPTNLSGIIGILASLTIVMAYLFGRVAMNISLGKLLQKKILPEKYQSESFAILIGSLAWVFILSIPYFGNLAVVLLFATSLGLVVTARSNSNWKGL